MSERLLEFALSSFDRRPFDVDEMAEQLRVIARAGIPPEIVVFHLSSRLDKYAQSCVRQEFGVKSSLHKRP
jgi:histidinol phosphatase-like PHP family hydrolase